MLATANGDEALRAARVAGRLVRRGTLEHGAEFIEKPFSSEQLARRVREVLDRTADAPAA